MPHHSSKALVGRDPTTDVAQVPLAEARRRVAERPTSDHPWCIPKSRARSDPGRPVQGRGMCRIGPDTGRS